MFLTARWFGCACAVVIAIITAFASPACSAEGAKPNIVYILCDDLGWGDVSCLNPASKIQTPHFDRIAREGMAFRDVHSGSAVCSPTRYGVLTGRYAWRSKLQSGVLGGLSPRLIEPGRMTVASLLKEHGYHTACIGKWHLGMDWVKLPGKQVAELNIESPQQVNNVDYNQPIANGPRSVGFDQYFGISASLDMVPYTFIENERVTASPSESKSFAMFLGRNSQTRLGPTAPEFDAADVLPKLTERAVAYIAERAADAKKGQPFFLYLPYASPHTPILPTAPWKEKSGLNYYADFVLQTDDCVGQLLAALDKHGLAENTLVVLTSDNGCSPQADFAELAAKGHHPSGPFRGHKADIFEGGHRVPFLVRWPAKVKAGRVSEQTGCLTDLLATAAEIVGAKLPVGAGEDSVSFLPALLGEDKSPLREATVHHSINGSFAIRQGDWKLCFCRGSGGWSAPKPGQEASELPADQLFNLKADLGEIKNVAAENPEIVARLTALMEKYLVDGRSTPGPAQSNAVPIVLRKSNPTQGKKKAAK
jgi:arylsulfatase A